MHFFRKPNLLSMIRISRRNFPLCFSTRSLLATLFITVLLSSCSFIPSKDNYIQSFSAFITDVKEHYHSYTDDDWNKADLKYNKFAEQDYNKYRNELTEADKELVGRLKGVYNVLVMKREVKGFFEQAEDLIYEAKGVVEEMGDTIY